MKFPTTMKDTVSIAKLSQNAKIHTLLLVCLTAGGWGAQLTTFIQ